jgi:nitroreductase
MNLEETIYKRRSVRKYGDNPLAQETLDEIREFIGDIPVLNPDINWSYEIVGPENVKTLMRWKAPHYLVIFSEPVQNYFQNIGFIFQQVDLFLQSKGIGTCWIGAGSPKNYENPNPEHEFVILLAFGNPSGELYRNKDQFKRKDLSEISDKTDERLIPAQFAPSAANSQTWYFKHNDDGSYDVYRNRRRLNLNNRMINWNKIDIGIALAHLYISNTDTFASTLDKPHKELKGKVFEMSFVI